MNKKFASLSLLICLMVTLMMFGFAGCSSTNDGNGNDQSTSGEAEQVYEMKIAHGYPDTVPHGKIATFFKEKTEELTDGRMQVIIYPNAQLGAIDKEPGMIRSNTIQASLSMGIIMETINPYHGIYTIPFLVDSPAGDGELIRLVDESPEVGGVIAEKAEEYGFKHLGFYPTAFGNFMIANNTKPVIKPGDGKGLKIRYPSGEQNRLLVESLESSPISMSGAEVPVALSQGVVDGFLSGLVHYHNSMWHTKYLTVNHFNVTDIPLYANLEWWNSLPEDIKDIIENEVVLATKDFAYKQMRAYEMEIIETIQKEPYNVQVDFMDMDDPDTQAWVEETRQKGIDLFVGNVGEEGQKMVDAVLKIKEEMK